MAMLAERFPTSYADFFSKCTRVASAPHSFFWFGELAGFWGGQTVLQKLPIRFYVGLQPIDKGRFEIEPEFSAYNRAEDRFEQVHFDDFLIKRLSTYGVGNLRGWRLRFLSEISIGVSLGAVGALAAALATLTKPTKNKISLFKEAWRIARLLQDNQSSGASVFAALAQTAYPIVFSSQWPSHQAKTLDKLANLKGEPVWPIDFGLVFSGTIVKGESVLRSIEAAKERLEQHDGQAWQTYLDMLNLVTKQAVAAMGDLFKRGASEPEIERLFDLMNQYQNLMHFISISTPEIDEIYGSIHQIANKTENRVGSGAKISGIGKGGEVLVAMPFGKYRDKLDDWLKSRDYSLDYASWADGFESEGVRIEQDIKAKVYSQFLKGDLVTLQTWRDNRQQTALAEYTKVKPKDF